MDKEKKIDKKIEDFENTDYIKVINETIKDMNKKQLKIVYLFLNNFKKK